jgi:hypothetical protein
MLKRDFRNIDCKGVDWVELVQDSSHVGFSEHGYEPLDSIKAG